MTHRAALHEASLDLMQPIYPPETGVRLVGLTVSNFEAPVREELPALPLFGLDTNVERAPALVDD